MTKRSDTDMAELRRMRSEDLSVDINPVRLEEDAPSDAPEHPAPVAPPADVPAPIDAQGKALIELHRRIKSRGAELEPALGDIDAELDRDDQ